MDEKFCDACGAKLMARWERLSPLLVKDLVKFYTRVNEKGVNDVHPPTELHLSATEYNNFQKLRFHALVYHVKDKPGHWLLTKRGAQFLSGDIAVPSRVKIFRNRIQEHGKELVTLRDVLKEDYLDVRGTFDYEPELDIPDDKPLTSVVKPKYVFNRARGVYEEI